MSMFCIQEARPVLFSREDRACRFAFDGCHYYFTLCGTARIVKTDLALCPLEQFDTCRIYDCICYDPCERCFWASAHRAPLRLFRLDCSLRETDAISLSPCPEARGELAGLSFDCCTNSILLAYPAAVLALDKKEACCQCRYRSTCGFLTGLCSLSPGLLVTRLHNGCQELLSLDPCGEIVALFRLERDVNLQGIVYRPCGSCAVLDCLLLRQGCYSYLYERPFHTEDFGFTPCPCNDHYCSGACCPLPAPKPDSEQACTDVIESVALVEAALAHILNAEGEKLQKVIAESCDFDELMCVNKEVNRTLIHATQLEQALYAKLAVLSDICPCESDCPSPCMPSCPSPRPPCRSC